MSTANLPISRLVSVSVVLSALAAQAQNLSSMLVLTSTGVIDVVERIRVYPSLAAVAVDFGSTGPEYECAKLWFQQAPQPSQIQFGRWAKTAAAGVLRGGTLSAAAQAIALFNAVTTPAFQLDIDSVPYAIAPASFAGAANLNGVAAIIATALNTASAGTTCVWNASFGRFEITSGTTGATSAVSFAKAPTAVGSITFATNPVAASTITLGGTAVTFVAAAPVGNQVLIGVDTPTTLANLLAFLTASTDVNLVKFTYSVLGTKLYLKAAAPGAAGASLTIAASVATTSGATLAGGTGTGTDVSTLLGLASTSAAAYRGAGVAAETALAAATLFDASYGQTWYSLVIPEAIDADDIAVAGYIEATNNKHFYGITSQDANEVSTVNTTSIGYRIKQLAYKKTAVQYSSSSAYAVCSLLGRIQTVDYTGNATVITLMYKQEPGIVAEQLNATQMAALKATSTNVFVGYNNNTAIIEAGTVGSGDFIDTIIGADALAIDVQNAVYNQLYTSPTKIPQTDAGINILVTAVAAVCLQYVVNGLGAPGVWSQAGFGNLAQGDFLPKGFYIYAAPVATQSDANRQARKAPPIQVAFKLAGAVHTVDVILNINR